MPEWAGHDGTYADGIELSKLVHKYKSDFNLKKYGNLATN